MMDCRYRALASRVQFHTRKLPISLPAPARDVIPAQTIQVARAAFPKGHPYMHMRDALGPIYTNATFATFFSHTGRPAEAPAQLALITVMPCAEGLSDAQAADAVRARIDWKYALALALTDHRSHKGDQDSDFPGNGESARRAALSQAPPMVAKSLFLPDDRGAGLDKCQGGLPTGPEPGQPRPEEAISRLRSRAAYGLFIDRNLMLKGEDLQGQRAVGAKQ